MADGSSVKVAVRLRPFNGRERDMNAKCCIKMQGPNTIIYHPETNEDKKFAFDFSYWSHDGFTEGDKGELIPQSPQYATQRMVYEDLGGAVLTNAFEGYNSTLFAYGQTGAGKSFSMVGYGVNKGIIPIVCSEMFKAVETAKKEGNKAYEVTCTMLEIYNEVIRDLLDLSVNGPGGLKVRSKPGIGVYVEKLTPVAVDSYEAIEKRMDEGTGNRTVASTKMNATSSRAHTVFGINFTQRVTDTSTGQVSETTARMNLVDLAGSERAESTGATGDRLKEGCAINASLSALGNVISALADIAGGKKKVFVPYRNSALTRLLQDALGGNSKTVMIAALSPADVNYDETLGTLRYADRAKKIKNKVEKMENPTDKIIRMLKEENARLMALLSGKGIDAGPSSGGGDGEDGGEDGGGSSIPAGANPEEIEALKAKMMEEAKSKMEEQMKENERMIEEMKKSWEQKLKEAGNVQTSQLGETGATSMRNALASDLPRIVNLHEDTQLSECVVYMFKKGTTKIGRKNNDVPQDVMLSGLNISKEHAIVIHGDDGSVKIQNLNKSKTFVNGDIVTDTVTLHSGDRVILGNNFVFRYDHPNEENKCEHVNPDQAWANAMDEFATKQGMRLQQSLGGEMGKLEVEEAQKRKELEAKLAAMEETMRKEREVARSALDQQKQTLMSRLASGGQLTEDEKKQMAASEAAFKNKEQDLEAEMSKRRDLSEKIIQEQMKRKRQTKKIEERLGKLMPLVAEANSMAEELGKPVRFEARLAVKSTNVNLSALDELRNLKTIDVTIRVTSQENGNVWTWNHVKFDSRLYMMREIYQEFMDYGPREIPKSKDPFWDPPEAIEIGKAYVYLKALSQLVEIENEFSIVDYKGDEQGQLQVDIYPEGLNGEEIGYLESSDELIGKSINLLVRVSGAKGLPAKFSNDVYVTFAFGDQTCETEACDIKTQDPKWKFEHRFKFESITDEFRQYLLKDAAVFEVRGFSDPPVDSKQQTVATGAATTSTAAGTATTKIKAENLCGQCEEKLAHFNCHECQLQFCDDCFNLLHKSAKKAGHLKIELAPPPSAAAKALQCFQCEENAATVQCKDCDKQLCENCNQLLHKSEKKAKHERVALSGAAHATHDGKCQQCDEEKVVLKCEECSKALCMGCDGLLHKSAKKAVHARVKV